MFLQKIFVQGGLVQVENNFNETQLPLIIYKASSRLFPLYERLFGKDKDDFQQLCAVLALNNLKYYDERKCEISTFIYNFLPMWVNKWVNSNEGQTLWYETHKLNIDDVDDDDSEKYDSLFVSDENIIADYENKLIRNKIKNILSNYPVLRNKIYEDLSFSQIAKKLKMSKRQISYKYAMELKDLIDKNDNFLKTLYQF